ncbi:MFS transporter [Zunongwangia sp. SCSIO 43204]|uniref:MFS transporter, DHA1 family, arabinose polymer transporter n=1 Tax=Zunongwangia mangrovi TaxID=1334022 RepID=A0A1I1J9P8_9FLAO|nr:MULTISPECIES: MFS transporter [Zunongwangia]UAB82748.1 MFS transporter [Zunongwangia sp. SCSIO 43204]SFC42160.1 MFS transporter, DHA1 family, arabinose polymer transporter [Zunongwangia mangrovi]
MNKGLIALAIGGFGIGMTEFVIMGILPDVATALDISIPQAGHFISAYALGVVVGAPLLTGIGGKWPAHKTLLFLMLWFTVFNSLSAFADSYTLLLISRFLSGLPHGAFFGIGAVVASKLAKPGKEARAIATMFTGLTLANVIGVPLGTYFGHNFSWNVAFMLVGIVGICAILGIKFWMPELPKSSPDGIAKDFKVLKKLELWMVILLTTIGTGGFFAWYSYIAPLITEVAGHPETIVSYAMILAGLGMVTGNFIGAKLAESFSPIYAVLIALILMVIALVSNTYLAYDKIGVLVMTFLIGTIAFCLSTPVQMAVINSAKGSEMLGSSLNQSAFNMGNASGAYLAGLPIAAGYAYTSADLVGAGMASAGIVITFVVIYIRKKNKKATQTAQS